MAIYREYHDDAGVLFVFLLNIVQLQPKEAIFLTANEPHAYISGDCMEIMASSDNVVRAGLTPKFKDVTTLCSMLTFKCQDASIAFKVSPIKASPNTFLYKQPGEMKDFAILMTVIDQTSSDREDEVLLDDLSTESIIFCAKGHAVLSFTAVKAVSINAGSVLYLSAVDNGLSLKRTTSHEPVWIFRAFQPQ